MGIKGRAREREFVKKTGFFEGDVICINPDRERLEKMLNVTLDKDPEYLTTDTDGKTTMNLVIWVKDVKTGEFRNIRLFLKNTEKTSMDKKKRQYVNEIGMLSWSDSEMNLPDWFISREYRVAHEGEEELYNFAVTWLNKLDIKDPDTTLVFDWKKLMKGDVREISEQVSGEYAGTICCLVTMRTVNSKGEPVEYEQVYNKEFLPGYTIKQIRARKIDESFIESAKLMDRKKRNKLQKFVLNVTDSKYGIKDFFTLGELIPYDPSQNMAASTDYIREDDTSY